MVLKSSNCDFINTDKLRLGGNYYSVALVAGNS